MKRRFLLLLLLAVIGAVFALWLSSGSGYLVFVYNKISIETSLWFAALCFVLLVIFFVISSFFVIYFFQIGTPLQRWFQQRRQKNVAQKITQGWIDLTIGNWKKAEQLLGGVAEKSENPLIIFLAAARAAHEDKNYQQSESYITKAYELVPEGEIAIGLTQAELMIKREKFDQALALLLSLDKKYPKHAPLLLLLKDVYQKLGDWKKIVELIPRIKKRGVVNIPDLELLDRQANRALFEQITKRPGFNNKEVNIKAIEQAWEEMTPLLKSDLSMQKFYVDLLISLRAEGKAETFIRQILKKDWSDILLHEYGKISGDDIEKQLFFAETWLKDRSNNSALLLCLGRLSLRNKLWGKAREYFESSYKLKVTPDVCGELSRLLLHMGDKEKADYFFSKRVQALNLQLPDLPMP